MSAFFIWIHAFWLVDRFMIHTAKKGIRHPWRKYRLQVIVSMLNVLIGTLELCLGLLLKHVFFS